MLKHHILVQLQTYPIELILLQVIRALLLIQANLNSSMFAQSGKYLPQESHRQRLI